MIYKYSIDAVLDYELSERDKFKKQILDIVFSYCEISNTNVKRGQLQTKVYHHLGFHGRCGNHFAMFLNKLLAANGFRRTIIRGDNVYCGLAWKASI